MKIASVTVLYNFDNCVYENILTYYDEIDKLYLIDNSDKNNIFDNDFLVKYPKIEYKKLNGNKGIAYALKLGCDNAINECFDFILTMDQDSKIDGNSLNKMISYTKTHNMSSVGLLCLNTTEFRNPKDNGVKEIDSWITSGNLINLINYKKIDGFNSQLFIDLVDFDLCHQFYKKNLKIILLLDCYINHKIGEPIYKKVLHKNVISSNHSKIRYYYMYRNELYLYNLDKEYYKDIHKRYMKDILRMLLVEKTRFQKLKMIIKGRRDAKKGKLGGYNE